MPHFDAIPRRAAPPREIKRAPVAISAVNEAGVFEGYASLFGVVDLGRDLVTAGAFRATLARRGISRIKMLWQHEANEPIGAWLSITEDARGLRVKGRLNLAVARAREVLALMRDGTVDGLSIGYRAEKAFTDKMTGIRRLETIDLWEISVVTFPMLPQARVSSVKHRPARLLPMPAAPRRVHTPPALPAMKYEIEACRLEVKLLRLTRAMKTKFPSQGA